jgi:hypothetical protein
VLSSGKRKDGDILRASGRDSPRGVSAVERRNFRSKIARLQRDALVPLMRTLRVRFSPAFSGEVSASRDSARSMMRVQPASPLLQDTLTSAGPGSRSAEGKTASDSEDEARTRA